MCQPLPGPRCSRHASDRLEAISQSLDQAIAQYDRIKHGNQSEKKERLLQKIDALQASKAEAQRDYNCTPKGIEALENRLAQPGLSRADKTEVEITLQLALADRDAHVLAGKVFERHKGLSSEDQQRRTDLLSREARANHVMANSLNTGTNVAESTAAARVAKTNRLKFEEHLRRKVAGFSSFDQIPAYKATGSHQAFVPLKPSEFGRVSSYLPYGGYARVTKVDMTPEGNAVLHLEGSVARVVSRNAPLVLAR